MNELTHASFFSGVGGLDLGLERAGWRTVSFSEIDPYASAVLAERWPGVPNLGDICSLSDGSGMVDGRGDGSDISESRLDAGGAWHTATLWSGGFPCQDLSVAGKRAGFAGARSSLAFAFLDLVERHRPPAILLENVPGLLSSHRGRDFGTLLDRLAQLGYGWAYRILDARHFGVPQRRRRVFIVALNLERGLGADSAAAVLSVGTRCPRHPATGHAAGEGVAERPERSVAPAVRAGRHGDSGIGRDNDEDRLILGQAVNAKWAKGYSGPAGDEHHNLTLSPPPDPGGVRAPDGLAGRLDDLAPTLRVGPARPQDGGPGDTVPVIAALRASTGGPDDNRAQGGQLVAAYRKATRSHFEGDWERWEPDQLTDTIDANGHTARTATAVLAGPDVAQANPLLPLGLDSHRYRCCGNGVVSSVAEWIGTRLAEVLA